MQTMHSLACQKYQRQIVITKILNASINYTIISQICSLKSMDYIHPLFTSSIQEHQHYSMNTVSVKKARIYRWLKYKSLLQDGHYLITMRFMKNHKLCELEKRRILIIEVQITYIGRMHCMRRCFIGLSLCQCKHPKPLYNLHFYFLTCSHTYKSLVVLLAPMNVQQLRSMLTEMITGRSGRPVYMHN